MRKNGFIQKFNKHLEMPDPSTTCEFDNILLHLITILGLLYLSSRKFLNFLFEIIVHRKDYFETKKFSFLNRKT